jgi:hypothetical protein
MPFPFLVANAALKRRSSTAMRVEIYGPRGHRFGIHAQRDPPLPWTVPARLGAPSSSAKNTRSSSTNACSSITSPARDRALRRFAFLGLAVMTQSYIRYRHDDMFLQEHWARVFLGFSCGQGWSTGPFETRSLSVGLGSKPGGRGVRRYMVRDGRPGWASGKDTLGGSTWFVLDCWGCARISGRGGGGGPACRRIGCRSFGLVRRGPGRGCGRRRWIVR